VLTPGKYAVMKKNPERGDTKLVSIIVSPLTGFGCHYTIIIPLSYHMIMWYDSGMTGIRKSGELGAGSANPLQDN